jgi:hypothetical protein
VLSFDYLRQEKIRKFLEDGRRTGRPKSIIIDGCVLVYELLVIGFATRTAATPEAIKKKHGNLRPLARTALNTSEQQPLCDLICAIAAVRNTAAHEPISDEEFEKRFVTVWSSISCGVTWPESLPVRSSFCRALFSLIAFELGRWQADLPPSGFLTGAQLIDWERMSGDRGK